MVYAPLTNVRTPSQPLSRGLGLTIAATMSLTMWVVIGRLILGG